MRFFSRLNSNKDTTRPFGSEGGQGFESFGDDRFSDFFESLFGAGSQRSQTRYRGQDVQAHLQLTLGEAYTTHQQTFNINGKNVRITVPAGVEDGQVIKLKGHGGEGETAALMATCISPLKSTMNPI